MKKIAMIASALLVSAFASEGSFEKSGFLATAECIKTGDFTNCKLENYACGSDGCFRTTESGIDKMTPLVLYSHDDGITYKLDTTNIPRHEMDEGVNRNAVSVTGEYDASTQTIVVQEFKAPPPPKKSFFKGCL